VALKLVRLGLADAALFGANGEIWQASDVLWKKPVILKRGSFDPITKLNLDMIERGQAAFQADFGEQARDNLEILEITMHNLLASGAEVPDSDFLARADILQALGKNVLISKYPEFHRVSSYLARHTQCPIGIILGLPLFQELFNERWCTDLEGGLLVAFGRKGAFSIACRVVEGIRVPEEEEVHCRRVYMTMPPSTVRHCPVMYPASALARKATAEAMSSGLPKVPAGI
jgi:hypothetical protein